MNYGYCWTQDGNNSQDNTEIDRFQEEINISSQEIITR